MECEWCGCSACQVFAYPAQVAGGVKDAMDEERNDGLVDDPEGLEEEKSDGSGGDICPFASGVRRFSQEFEGGKNRFWVLSAMGRPKCWRLQRSISERSEIAAGSRR